NVFWLLLAIAAVVGTVLTGWWWIAACGLLPLALIAQSLLLTPRRVRAIGYLDGEEDLTIASGIMFRSVHSIPYGRVQSVKIGEGPVERRYGLATLTITTAAGGGTETLPGLPRPEAERLRSMLTDRGIELVAALRAPPRPARRPPRTPTGRRSAQRPPQRPPLAPGPRAVAPTRSPRWSPDGRSWWACSPCSRPRTSPSCWTSSPSSAP